MAAMNTPTPPAAVNLRRLVLLRTIALGGQALAVWVAVVPLRMPVPQQPLVAILAGLALVNVLTGLRLGRDWPVRDGELFAHFLLDVLAFTGLLYFTGGSTNPFVPLYLLPIALAAVVLPRAYVWALATATVAGYTALLFFYVPLPGTHAPHDDAFRLHVVGMWAGFLLSAGLISWFSVKMADTRRERDRLAAEMREQALRHERVLALGTLATGAAHELGTPLSTLAVLVKDLAPDRPVSAATLTILREQVVRCREILASLTAEAGAARAEAGASRPLDDYLREVVAKWCAMRPEVSVITQLRGTEPVPRIVSEQTLSQAITSILNNAADVSPQSVEVNGEWSDDQLVLEIADRGPGLAPEVRARVGASVVTTKGEGLGLGLFLAHTTLHRLGGRVALAPRAGGGTLCRLTLPLAPVRVTGP